MLNAQLFRLRLIITWSSAFAGFHCYAIIFRRFTFIDIFIRESDIADAIYAFISPIAASFIFFFYVFASIKMLRGRYATPLPTTALREGVQRRALSLRSQLRSR